MDLKSEVEAHDLEGIAVNSESDRTDINSEKRLRHDKGRKAQFSSQTGNPMLVRSTPLLCVGFTFAFICQGKMGLWLPTKD